MSDAIKVQRADDASITLTLSNSDGSAYDATGKTLNFTVRKHASSTPVITKPITSFTGTGHNIATIALTKADLTLDVRAWRYELTLTDAGGTNRRSSGFNAFYVTENDGQPGTVNVQIGSSLLNIAVTLSQSATKVTSVNSRTGDVVLTKADVGLDQVNNTSDAAKPVSTATQTALNAKANTSSLSPVATSGSYVDLTNKPTIPTQYTDAQAAAAAPVQTVAGRTGNVTLAKTDVGLPNVDNTADANKPVSNAQQSALNQKLSDLTDAVVSAPGSLAAGTNSGVTAAGTYTAPAPAATVTTPPQRFAITNRTTGDVTLSMPNPSGSTLTLTVWPGEVVTFRQASTLGYINESGNKPLSQLLARLVSKIGDILTGALNVALNGVTPGTFVNTPLNGAGSVNDTLQINIQNQSNGTSASSDYVATANNGTDASNYVDLGINSSTYADAGFTIGGPLDSYLYANGGNLAVGTQTAAKDLIFHTAGTLAANERMRIKAGGNVGIGTNNPQQLLHLYGNQRGILIESSGDGPFLSLKGSSSTSKVSAGFNGDTLFLQAGNEVAAAASSAFAGVTRAIASGGIAYDVNNASASATIRQVGEYKLILKWWDGTASQYDQPSITPTVDQTGATPIYRIGLRIAGGEGLTLNNSRNVGIGSTSPGERLQVEGGDATIRIKNTGDPIGGFIGNTYTSLQLGLYNPTGTTSYTITPNTKRVMFGMDATGKVGSFSGNFGGPSFRNVLDDGLGNAWNTGNFQVGGVGVGSHSLTLPSASSGIAYYNTGDQTTNYERARIAFASNTFTLLTEKGGTGTGRNINISSSADFKMQATNVLFLQNDNSSNVYIGTGNTNGNTQIQNTYNSSSTTQTAIRITPTIAQTGTASYTALLVSPTETSTGSGTKLLADFQVAGTSKAKIDSTGSTTVAGFSTAITTVTTATTLDATMHTLRSNSASALTHTLPTVVGSTGRIYVIKNVGTGAVTVATTSSQTIDGATTYSLPTQYKYVTVQSNGTNWDVIGNN